ncbi:hypothetical protein IV203_011637 [Nitzschia inconspicua]|uniref:Uncharacterized protein n=1 Tax=Nitzschia inconspicua TaxID=303405 RepID=A0A9K3KSG6_9STRA|nr:hypothetical protein IV203_011637 [Nitzschia inconspicua]
MGNDASKKNKSLSSSEQTNTITNTTNDILNDKFSDFEDISHPSSPETNNSLEKKQKTDNAVSNTEVIIHKHSDEMSYSGVLVEKTGSIIMSDHTNVTVSSMNTTSAFSAAPPTTSSTPRSGDNNPNNNINNSTSSNTVKPNPNRRRIIKATPPPPAAAATTVLTATKIAKEDDDDDDDSIAHHGGGKQHLPAVLSPKASSELLQESIEQSKSKRLEKLSRDQKSKREKLLDAKRRGLKTGSDKGNSDEEESSERNKPQPNPFSRFLRVFSVEPEYPHHKRAYEESEIDREVVVDTADTNKTVVAATATAATTTPTIVTSGRHSPSVVIAAHNDSKRQKLSDESHDTDTDTFSQKGKVFLSSLVQNMPEWVPVATASAAMAAVAVMVALKLNAITSGANTKTY